MQPLTTDQLSILRLLRGRGIGPATFFKLVGYHKTPESAVLALEAEKGRLVPASESQIQREYKRLCALQGRFVFYTEQSYPQVLKHIPDPPPVLSILGNAELLNQPTVALVGARNASINGRKIAQKMAEDLGNKGWVVASGLARGIDTAAHQGALQTSAKTIAVLGGGLDHIYPPENTDLFWQIAKQGVIVAETPLGSKPTAQSFPRRNRIISGLAGGVVVVEAARHSGSLITAQLAGEQGREVMAVPGHPSDPRSLGCNHLLRQGAILVQSAQDVIETVGGFDLGHQAAPALFTRENQLPLEAPPEDLVKTEEQTPFVDEPNPDENAPLATRILGLLTTGQTAMDDVTMALKVPEGELLAALAELELDGKIQRLSGGYISRVDGD